MKKVFVFIIVGLLLEVSIFAQSSTGTPASGSVNTQRAVGSEDRIQSLKLESKLMGRKMPYRVILPLDYDGKAASGRNFPVIYLLHGLSGHFDNWTEKTKVADYSKAYDFIIVTPEGGDGWYTDNESVPTDKYESYIISELIPEVDKRFRTNADRRGRVIAGLSMGGYGSLKFGLKYPDKFFLVGSFSGALGVAGWTEKNIGKSIGGSIDRIFGPEGSNFRKSNNIFEFIRDLTPEKTKRLPFIYQSCGTEDFLFGNNNVFRSLLDEKHVPHEYREHPGGHDWAFWDDQVREFLALVDRKIG